MSGCLPTSVDFDSKLNVTITPPPASQQMVNILILLHGLGDTNASFTALGKQLALPETACISLQAPTPLPFDLGGFHWGDDIQFDSNSGDMDSDTGFGKATKTIQEDVISQALVQKCGLKPRNIFIYGFGQGGMTALATALSFSEELGGVISIGGPIPASSPTAKRTQTPALVVGGSSNTLVTKPAIAKMRTAFETLEYHKWKKSGDGMPANREEMLPIMKFFARRLRSAIGVPKGSLEIG